jgi:predicted nuclease of predicted toxin-antitoxin system
MNFVADEGVDWPIVTRLRQLGHVVWYVAEASPSISDAEVLSQAENQQAILLTCDKDFGEMVFRQNVASRGVVLMRLHGLTLEQKTAVVENTLAQYGTQLANAFTVITPTKIRIRPQNH